MIADLHCHYPMHLLPAEHDPLGRKESWARRIIDNLKEDLVGLLAHIVNNREWDSGWRVSLDGLEQGGAKIVCSVLYWPPAEFEFDRRLSGTPPLKEYFDYVEHQLKYVENDLRRQDPDGTRLVIVKNSADLERDGLLFVHCLEGGFQLGPEIGEIDEKVEWLANEGVLYITVAHLFFREVATNAPAIPMFTDAEYAALFPQPDEGLTELGRAVVRAMHKHKVLVDISHMTEKAIDETFALVEKLNEEAHWDREDYPVIATHVGMREVENQPYNLSKETAEKIQECEGVIGLITAQHQIGATKYADETRAILAKHLGAIDKALGKGHSVAALGTDFDGFIRPTLAGLQSAKDFKALEQWIREARQAEGDAEAIVHENAARVIKKAFAGRPSPPAPPQKSPPRK
jgi:microsomal dipeptidase-like Zn-dependent dipeptidase